MSQVANSLRRTPCSRNSFTNSGLFEIRAAAITGWRSVGWQTGGRGERHHGLRARPRSGGGKILSESTQGFSGIDIASGRERGKEALGLAGPPPETHL